ncbi:MAG: hypothetical protein H7Z15_05545 [Rhizobacter sp.]|nr:hypothetical protein [Rhizobacter sp.]
MTRIHHVWCLLAACALSIWLAGCGGGGDDPAPPPAAAITLSGVAATGLPMTGTVTLKDALGATRTTAIGANGSYTVDTRGLTAPLGRGRHLGPAGARLPRERLAA